VSASQVTLFRDCERKWAFRYLDRIETPTHPAAALGTEVQDEQIDPYLLTGRAIDFSRPSGEIANALIPLLPEPGAATLRRRFVIPSPSAKFAYQGELDLWSPDSGIVPGIDGGRPLVGDVKTTSNLKYARTETTLSTDVQANLYAMAMMYEEAVDSVDAVWFYVRTRPPHKTQRTHVVLTAEHVSNQFREIDSTGLRITNTRKEHPKANELAPNVRMCEQYGGCPYRSICDLSPADHAAGFTKERTMDSKTNDFLNQLRKAATPGPASTTPAPTQYVRPAEGSSLSVPVISTPVISTPAEAAAAGLPAWASASATDAPFKGVAVPINPPEAAIAAAPPAPVEAPAPAKRTRGPNKATAEPAPSARFAEVEEVVAIMRKLGVCRLSFDGAAFEIEVFELPAAL